MTRITPEALYALLPAVHRMRDADEGEPLRALLAVLAREGAVIEENIEQLLDDLFVETCDDWAAPYVGGIIGYRPLHPLGGLTTGPRAEVANTIGYRRRKGTAAVLEQLARDVTGWPARVVEYFQLVATCQHMNHVRPDHHWAPDLGDPLGARTARPGVRRRHPHHRRPLDHPRPRPQGRGGPSQPPQHRHLPLAPAPDAPRQRPDHPDRRPPPPLRPARRPPPARQPPRGRGDDHQPRPAAQRPRRHHPPRPPRRPRPLVRPHRRRPRPRLRDHRRRRADPGRRHRGLRPVGRRRRLEPRRPPLDPAAALVRVDPELGRIAFPEPEAGEVRTTFHTGFPAPIGGGAYDRAAGLAPPTIERPLVTFPHPVHTTLQQALDALPRPAASSRSPPTTSSPPPPPSTPPPAPRSSSAPPTASARSSAPPPRSSSPAAPTPASPSTARSSKATRWRSPPTPTATPSPP